MAEAWDRHIAKHPDRAPTIGSLSECLTLCLASKRVESDGTKHPWTASDITKVARRVAYMFHCQNIIIDDVLTRCGLPEDCGLAAEIEAANPDLLDPFFTRMSASDLKRWVKGEISFSSNDPAVPVPIPRAPLSAPPLFPQPRSRTRSPMWCRWMYHR